MVAHTFSTRGRIRAAWLFGTLLVTAFACSGTTSDDDDDDCTTGDEGCRCTNDNRCLSGLTCIDDECVDLSAGGNGGAAGEGEGISGGTSSGGTKNGGTGGDGDAGSQEGGDAGTVSAGGTSGAVSGGTGGGGTGGGGTGGQGTGGTGDVAGMSGSAGNATGSGGSAGTGASHTCGDGHVEIGEACDLGTDNGLFYGDGTGCSRTCTVEPKCRDGAVTRACDTVCGDGNIDAGEACDDGNGVSGDGCADDCTVEDGFTCSSTDVPDSVPCPSAPGVECLVLPVTYRDFDPSTSKDFFYLGKNSVTCVPNATGTPAAYTAGDACPSTDASGPCPGIAAAALDADGKPKLGNNMCRCIFTDWDQTGVIDTAPTCWVEGNGSERHRIDTTVKVVDSPESFKTWYAGPGVKSTLELAAAGAAYQFSSSISGAPAGTAGRTIYDDIHANCLGTATPLQSGFFPLDAFGAKICNIWPYWAYGNVTTEVACRAGAGFPAVSQWDPQASYDNCPTTGTGGPVPKSDGSGTAVQGVMHNFYFTTEARYLFRYSGVPSTLSFFGDDDVWVFVNGKLKLDLGAPHERITGTATIGDAADALVAGKIYEIALFHADRNPRESNFQLTLSGFSRKRSSCIPQ